MFTVIRDDGSFYTVQSGDRVVTVAPHMKKEWFVVLIGKEEEWGDLFMMAVSIHASRFAAVRMVNWITKAENVFFQGM